MSRNADYRFDRQLAAGLVVEEWFYEMTCGGDRFEVKNDRLALTTGRVYVEISHSPGATGTFTASGVESSEADCFIFALGDPPKAFIGVSTARLRALVARPGRRVVDQPHGSCPTRGVLVDLSELLGLERLRLAA